MVEVPDKKIEEICDKIRDIINDIEIKVVEGKIDEGVASELREEIEKIIEILEGL